MNVTTENATATTNLTSSLNPVAALKLTSVLNRGTRLANTTSQHQAATFREWQKSSQASPAGDARLLMTYDTRAFLSGGVIILSGISAGIALSLAYSARWEGKKRSRLDEENKLLNDVEDCGDNLLP